MPVNSRLYAAQSPIIQDTDQVNLSLDTSGEQLTFANSPYTLANIYKYLFSLPKILGEKNRRKGATKFNGSDIGLTGTITSSGTTVTGSGTAFTTELSAGDFIAGTAGEYREIQSIASDTSLTLYSAFTSDIGVGVSFSRMQFLAERIDDLHDIGSIKYGLTVSPNSTGKWKIANGQALSRTSYASFFSKFFKTISATETTGDTFTSANHGFTNGDAVKFSFSGGSIVASTVYFVHTVTTDTFKVTSTEPTDLYSTNGWSSYPPTAVNLSDAASPGIATYANLGFGDGANTFNVPDFRGVFIRNAGKHASRTMAGGAGFDSGYVGKETNDKMQGHYHSITHTSTGTTGGSGAFTGASGSPGGGTYNDRVLAAYTDGTNGTPRTGLETNPVFTALSCFIRVA